MSSDLRPQPAPRGPADPAAPQRTAIAPQPDSANDSPDSDDSTSEGSSSATEIDGPVWQRWLPAAVSVGLLAILSAALLWPVPAGVMPRSGDHNVHLSRIHQTAQQVQHGRLAGWSETWFLGFPVGELYPQLGDLVVLAIGAITQVSWPTAYAWGFFLIFLSQGLFLQRAARRAGWGWLAATIAGALLILDPGAYREGGWSYTVS